MRHLLRACLALALGFALSSPAMAQTPGKLVIDQVRLGFPDSGDHTFFKSGMWAPVRIDVTNNGADRLDPSDYSVVLESTDGDDMEYQFIEKRSLPPIGSGKSETLTTYIKPGGRSSEVNVVIRSSDGQKTLASAKAKPENYKALSTDSYLCLTAGSRLPGLQRALNKDAGKNQKEDEEDPVSDEGAVKLSAVDNVNQLPTRWFGYSGVDLFVLTTAGEGFVEELRTDQTGRREALAEWVRRGGRLVISVGRNKQFVGPLIERMSLLPCKVQPSKPRDNIVFFAKEGLWKELNSLPPLIGPGPRNKPNAKISIDVTELEMGPGMDVLLYQKADRDFAGTTPLVVQGSCGLGRVILIAFDIDQAPFISWEKQDLFLTVLCQDMGLPTTKPAQDQIKNPNRPGSIAKDTDRQELATSLQDNLESFDDVPVVSFGWVALFIVLYILVVGPLDYWFLKKVVKRLELTWITFPSIVLIISTAAYFTAYYLKGDDLKINKLDVVDIDLEEANPHVYGTTWFTLFSPRIQNYMIGIEPKQSTWAAPPANQDNPYGTLVDTMGRPESQWNFSGRTGSQGLFRRAYEYAPDASGLVGVPVQVWSTKSFSASWNSPMSSTQPLAKADLRWLKNEENPVGTIRSQLPVILHDVVLLYHDNYFPVNDNGEWEPGRDIDVGRLKIGNTQGKGNMGGWKILDPGTGSSKSNPSSVQANSGRTHSTGDLMRFLLFYAPFQQDQALNSGLRSMDAYWRTRPEHASEIVIIGRTSRKEGTGPAEKVTQMEVSPSQLWLGKLPRSGQERPKLEGTLTQQTYVRIFVPLPEKPKP